MDDCKPLCVDLQISQFNTYETKDYYLAQTANGRFVRISAEVKILLELMDGKHTIEEIVTCVSRQYNANLTTDVLKQLIYSELIPKGLMIDDAEKASAILTRPSLHIPLVPSTALEKVGRIAAPLFKLEAIVFAAFFSFIVLSWYIFITLSTGEWDISLSIYDSVFVFLTVMLSFVIHEIGHVAASVKSGIIPKSAGIGLYFFCPVFYVDVSPTWLLPPKERLLVDAGGVYLQSIFLGVLTTMNLFIDNLIIHQAVSMTLLFMLINLFPFIKLDGYWILSDIIGLPNLDSRAREYLLNIIRRRSQHKYLSKCQRLVLPVFAAGKIAFIVSVGTIGFRNLYYLFSEPVLYTYFSDLANALLTLNMGMIIPSIFRLLLIGLALFYLWMIISFGGKKLVMTIRKG